MKQKKKIVIFGNQQVAIDCANWLRKQNNVQLVAFVGCERLRDKKYGYPSTRAFCTRHHIPFFQPEHLDDAFYKLFKSWQPDLCLSIYYRYIFSNRFLKVPRTGFINLHPSLLPKYRGAMPSLWALFNGEKKVGVTLHYIDRGIDSGDIIAQKTYILPRNIIGYTLHVRLMRFGMQLIKQYIPRILKNNAPRIQQDHSAASYYSAFDPTLRVIDWFSSSDRILSRVLALTKPYDGAVTHLLGKDVIFWNGRKYRRSKRNLKQPGKVLKVFENGSFVVSCVDGFLHVTDFAVQGLNHKKGSILLGARFM